jgi:8-oxo-dGTP diphosphatase
MQRYVAGFAFNQSNRVLLVRKKVPRWQVDLLNGVGGKIEGAETPCGAMVREFREETTLDTSLIQWKCFCVESHYDYEVHFFKTRLSVQDADRASSKGRNDVGEELHWYHVAYLEAEHGGELIGNLHWLVPMAQDWRDFQCRLTVRGNISERPTWQTW